MLPATMPSLAVGWKPGGYGTSNGPCDQSHRSMPVTVYPAATVNDFGVASPQPGVCPQAEYEPPLEKSVTQA